MTPERLAELRERSFTHGAIGDVEICELIEAVEWLQAQSKAEQIREELNVPLLEARTTRDAAIQRAETAERERERDELAKQLGLYRPDEPCHCGSGCHPRHCKRHPWAYDLHVAQINHEQLREERDELEKERDDLRVKLSKALSDYAEVAHAVGIEYVSDYVSAPGPIEVVIAAIDDLRRADGRRIDAETKLAACVAALETRARCCGQCEFAVRRALAATKGGGK